MASRHHRPPDGEYFGEDQLGQTLDSKQPIIRARVVTRRRGLYRHDGDERSSLPECTARPTHSAVMTVFGLLAGPACRRTTALSTDGIEMRKGSILDPFHPAPVRGRMSSAYRTASAVKRALANAAPKRFSAAGNDTTNTITMSRKHIDGYEMFAEILMGGNGAGPANDGAEVIAQMLSNTGNTPTEAIEMDHDFIRILEYSLIPNSGGAGVQRGGLGQRRVYEVLKDGVLISTNGDRYNTGPWALAGGQAGNLPLTSLSAMGKKPASLPPRTSS